VSALNCPAGRPARNHGARYHGARHHGRDGWSPWLIAAALVVVMPGLLVTACTAQPGSEVTQQNATAAQDSKAAAEESAPAAIRRPGGGRAIQLLAQAARAAVLMSYQGEEVVTRWSDGSRSVLVSDVWHVSGGPTVTQTFDAGTSFSSRPYLSSDTDGQAPEGVLGVTIPLVQLLEQHYVVGYAGPGSAGKRTAQVVEVWRSDGSLAARFRLDDVTKLPLEREVFDAAAHVIGQDVFINVRFASPGAAPATRSAAGSAAGTAPGSAARHAAPRGPWNGSLSPAQLLALRPRGWLVPSELPGLTLFTGAQTRAATGPVIGLGYSDGLSVVSVFEQHGGLATRLAGWRKTTVGGHPVFVAEPDQRSLTWSSHGMVYTVLADAPAETVAAVVGALPHDGPAGFWKRMSRGLVRLASWVNPFG